MKKVLVSVEGFTEEKFVSAVLGPRLGQYGVYPQPVLVSTGKAKQGKKFKGGLLSYTQAQDDIRRLLRDSSAAAVTTMYDYYRLPEDFPGYDSRPSGSGVVKAAHIERAFAQDIGDPRFRPYLQVHEFEALLFARPEITARQFPAVSAQNALREIRASFPSPEDINDHPQTAPSKRLLGLYPRYQKTIDGLQAAQNIGLDTLRAECPHFGEWLSWLEGLG